MDKIKSKRKLNDMEAELEKSLKEIWDNDEFVLGIFVCNKSMNEKADILKMIKTAKLRGEKLRVIDINSYSLYLSHKRKGII